MDWFGVEERTAKHFTLFDDPEFRKELDEIFEYGEKRRNAKMTAGIIFVMLGLTIILVKKLGD